MNLIHLRLMILTGLIAPGLLVAQTTSTQKSIALGGGTLTYTMTTNSSGECGGAPIYAYTFGGFSYTYPDGTSETLSGGGAYLVPPNTSGICGPNGPQTADPFTMHAKTAAIHFTYAPTSQSATIDIGGYIRPKFIVLGVVYAPPAGSNNSSNVSYGTSTVLGTATSLSNDFQVGNTVTVTASAGIDFSIFDAGSSVAYSNAYTYETNDTQSLTINKTSTNTLAIYPVLSTPGLSHDNDEFLVWLNPVINLQIPHGVANVFNWTGFSFDGRDQTNPNDGMDVAYVRAYELKNPAKMSGANKQALQRSWDTSARPAGQTNALTSDDYYAILSTDPFVSGSTAIDPSRFDSVEANAPFAPGNTASGSLQYQQISSQGLQTTTTYKNSFTIDSKFGDDFITNVNIELKDEVTWQTKTVASTTNTTTTTQTASYTIVGPTVADNYQGPNSFQVYRDNQFGTFLFAPVPTKNRFIPVTPCRIADTRNPAGTFGGPLIGSQQTRNFPIPSSSCNIPSSATAYSLNFTVVPQGGLGFLAAWPNGESQPGTSILNSDGRVKATAAIIPAGASGGVEVYASDATQLIIDVNGYFVPQGTSSSELDLYPVTPCRILDTRGANGTFGGPYLAAGVARTIPILSSSCNLPSSASAYSLNFTAVPHSWIGFLSTWPTGQAQPVVSTLNSNGAVTANAAIVPTGTGGAIQVYSSNDTDLVIDVNGYFAPPVPGGLSLLNIYPCRAYDSRTINNSTPLSGDSPINLGGSACLLGSPTPQAFVLNATVVPQGSLGFLSLWPDGTPWPGVSTLNASDDAITSNLAIVPTNNGSIDVRATSATQLILDVSAIFAP